MNRRTSGFRIGVRIVGSLLGTFLFDLIADHFFFYTERLNQNMLWISAIRIAVFVVCYFVLGHYMSKRDASMEEEWDDEAYDEEEEVSEEWDDEEMENDLEEAYYDEDDLGECEEIEDLEEEWEDETEDEEDEADWEEDEDLEEAWDDEEEYAEEEEDEDYEDEDYEDETDEEEYYEDEIDEEEYCEDEEADEEAYYDEEEIDEEEYYEEDEETEEEEDWEEDFEEYQEEIDNVTENVRQIFGQRNSTMLQAQKMMQSGNGSVRLEMAMHQNNEKCGRSSEEIKELMRRLQNPASGAEIERNLYRMQKHLEVIRNENQKVLTELNRLLLKQQEELKQERQEQGTGDLEDLFKGCTDKESLSRRYRSLMKTFHPDNAGGDLEMTQRIKKTYEELVKRYS